MKTEFDKGYEVGYKEAMEVSKMTTPTKEQIEQIRKEICCKLGISYSVLFGKKQP